jgi:predicted Rossmann fold flavoprotein
LVFDVIIIGGGAAGFFTAINTAEQNPNLKIAILERGKECLQKVKISGGGRCNVTHACFVPNDLVRFYPRGEKELRGPFHAFCSGDTIEWFEKKGIKLKIEEDGRMFPETDSSQTIIDCFEKEIKKYKIPVFTSQSVQNITQIDVFWEVTTQKESFRTKKIILATGSNPKVWELLQNLGHTIVSPVPSLFTFNIKDARIKDLMGVSAPDVEVKVNNTKLTATGPLLITHWGMSGPAILRLSAWGARELAKFHYQFTVTINWLKDYSYEEVLEQLQELKLEHAKKNIDKFCPFDLPKRLWESMLETVLIKPETKWADTNKKQLQALATELTQAKFQVNGKSTFKEEFVTAGGVDLKEIDFKTMQSKLLPNFYLVGEVLNIDAITGGFNFQNAWTGGFIASKHVADN